MKRLPFLFALLAFPCATILADNPPTPGGGMKGQVEDKVKIANNRGGTGMENPKDAAKMYIQTLSSTITLTDDQIQQINDIFAERAKQLADFNTQNAEKVKAVMAALLNANDARNQDALAKATQDYQDAYAPMQDIIRKASARLDKVLTGEQRAKLKDAQLTDTIKRFAAPTQLTDQQIKAVKVAAPDGDYMTVHEAIDNILTPAQNSALLKNRLLMFVKAKLYAANLTADQQTQVDAAADQVVKDTTLTPEEAATKIVDKIDGFLTPDQKKAVENSPNPYTSGGLKRAAERSSVAK